ncbi:MAG: DEAD/DEAH box helicase [Bacteroidota bacterium]
MNNSKPESTFLLITKHRQLGFVADVRQNATNPNEISSSAAIEIKKELSELAQSFSDSEIHRRFSRKNASLRDFLNHLDEELLQTQIRPFIDRQMDKLLHRAAFYDVQICFQDGPARENPSVPLTVETPSAEPWFCFTKRENGSDYVLELYQNDQRINLREKGNLIIINDPCWFKIGNHLLFFPPGFDGKKLQPFLTQDSIHIPSSAEKKYFETFITKTLKTGQVRAEGFTVQTLHPEKSMELSLEVDWQGRAVLIVYFRYGDKRIMRGKKQKVFIDLKMDGADVAFFRTERDFSWELKMLEFCHDLGLESLNENTLVLPGASGITNLDLYALVEWLNLYSLVLQKSNILLSTDRSPKTFYIGPLASDIKIIPGEDWFDVHAVVLLGGLQIPFIQLRKYILNEIREFPLPEGEIAVLPAEWFTRYSDLFYWSADVGDSLRVPLRHFSLITHLSAAEDPVLQHRLESLESLSFHDLQAPPDLKGTLRPYQLEGLQWLCFLHENHFGGCLADDMGLGKTIQALSLLLTAKPSPHKASLLIMPASLIHNWRNEIKKFAPSLRMMEHRGADRSESTLFFDSVDVILTTYGTLRNDLDLFTSYTFHYVILDESQVIKNPSAQVSRAVCQLNAEHRLVLTGTPIENSIADLWSQMEFLNPGMLGALASFQKRFKSVDTDAERMRKIIAPYVLRRNKLEVEPDLPPLTIKEIVCEMSDDQRIHYEREKSAVRNEILEKLETDGSPETSLTVLKALIRLRQMANHPKLVDPEYSGDSGKFEEIVRVGITLHEEGQKVLIFSSFVKHLKLVAARFEQEGLKYTMLTGSTIKREQVVDTFRKENNVSFFLISLKAGGTGLNLTEAGYVMMLDPWWNPAAEFQAINRAHRIGQDKKVIAYKFISAGTIEEKILLLQQRKQELADAFIPSGNPLKGLSNEEIKELFG